MSVSTLSNQNLQLSGSSGQTGPNNSGFKPWDLMTGRISDYQFRSFRYQGFFSDVAHCRVTDIEDTVAIKIFKKITSASQQPSRELDTLRKIRGLDPVHIVKFYENFEHSGHTCLVFELLDKNLDQLLTERRGKSLSLQLIRPIAQQLLSVLHSLKTAGIIHTNIKPHNVMLVKQEDQQPFRVKVIDFGSAISAAEAKCSSVTQPVGYRSPDVILGLPISEAVDMWSVAAVLSTLYLGSPLFPQRCQYHLMKTLVETLGQPDDELLSEGANTLLYFNSTEHTWTLKTPEEYKAMTGSPAQIRSHYSTRFKSLSELLELYPDVDTHNDKLMFVDLLVKMLHLNPQNRISPADALKHSFVTHSKEDNSRSHDMVSVPPVSISPMVTSSEEDASTNMDSGSFAAVCCNSEASDEAAVVVQTDLHDATSADKGPVDTSTSAELTDEVMSEAHETREAPRRPLKRIRRFFGRVFRALCCCCSTQVME